MVEEYQEVFNLRSTYHIAEFFFLESFLNRPSKICNIFGPSLLCEANKGRWCSQKISCSLRSSKITSWKLTTPPILFWVGIFLGITWGILLVMNYQVFIGIYHTWRIIPGLGYVVKNHGYHKSPKDRLVGPLPNGLNSS